MVLYAAVAVAGIYGVTGLSWYGMNGQRSFGPFAMWFATLWMVGACAVAAAGLGQQRARGIGRVFALSVLALLLGIALAAEAMSTGWAQEMGAGLQPPLGALHRLGFVLSWPAFGSALVEAVFALGER